MNSLIKVLETYCSAGESLSALYLPWHADTYMIVALVGTSDQPCAELSACVTRAESSKPLFRFFRERGVLVDGRELRRRL